METMEDEVEIDLEEIVRLLWNHLGQILAATVAAGLVCFLVCTFLLAPRYQASVELIVNTRQDTSGTVTNDNINSAKNMVSTYAIVIKSNTVLNMVIDEMDLDLTYEQLNKMVSVSSVDSTQIMRITVENEDPVLAGEIVQTIARIAPGTVVETVEAGSCKVVSDVRIHNNPVFPKTNLYTMVAALLGCAVVCGIIILQYFLHNYVINDEDVQNHLKLPVLGLIPEI